MSEALTKRLHSVGYAEGHYFCQCVTCGNRFIGAKRSTQCKPCCETFFAEWDAMTPEQQQERRESHRRLIEAWWDEHLTKPPHA